MRYLHTMVRVSDLDASLDFYVGKLGLVEVRRMENEKGRFTLVFLATPDDAKRIRAEASTELAAEKRLIGAERGMAGPWSIPEPGAPGVATECSGGGPRNKPQPLPVVRTFAPLPHQASQTLARQATALVAAQRNGGATGPSVSTATRPALGDP